MTISGRRTLSYKCFFIALLFVSTLVQVGRLVVDYVIDPIGIWGAPVIQGFNHYKTKQNNYLDVFHPYSYMREQPDVLFIGSSQINRGFAPAGTSHMEGRAYTMGFAGITLPCLREYLRFVYAVHKPKIIYLGFPLETISVERNHTKRSGFSESRLHRLSQQPWGYWMQLAEDALSLHGMHMETVKQSQIHKKEKELFFHGWYAGGGAPQPVDSHRYYWVWGLSITYVLHLEEISNEALYCLREILQDAREADVKLVVFFPPVSIDAQSLIHVMGYWPMYKKFKSAVAGLTPVYDFVTVNDMTTERTIFCDPTHFQSPLGESLKPVLEGKAAPEPYGYYLTSETADAAFAAEDAAWEKWKSENAEYVQALTECIESGRKPKVGDFAKYIGF